MKISQGKLFVKQETELAEIFTGFETKNKYSINEESGSQVFYAFGDSSFLTRNYVRKNGPVKIVVLDKNKKEVMNVSRKFFWWLPNWEVEDEKEFIGRIDRKWAILKKKYELKDREGKVIYECVAKAFSPWTFRILKNGEEFAVVKKKWSGVGKEMFSDADNFMVEFNNVGDDWSKEMILALAFAVDQDVFEKSNSEKNIKRDASTIGNLLKKS